MNKKTKNLPQDIINVNYSEEMGKSYLDYALSVITDRAIPDVRDGLKPVHRRILYGMKELGLKNSLPYKKSARIVGEVMGKYHPHGDSSIYDAMSHMTQDWCYIYPLVDGHGNFGSIEGDEQAASRYTEAKLSLIAEELFLQDLDKNIVDFIPNFDDNEKEPTILPVRIPNLLLSGTEGIAVGMASKIPTHNLGEIIDAVIAVLDNPKITTQNLMKHIKGPDFSTGGIIANANELPKIYQEGSGKIRVRGKYILEKTPNGKSNIVITEIPYTMIGSIDKFIDNIASLISSKELSDVTDIKNLSGKEGIKIIIETKKEANIDNIINILYKKAKFEDTFAYNAMAICNNVPKQLSIKEIFDEFITFNNGNYTKKYTHLLKKESLQKEIKEGLIKAIDCVDLIIEVLRGATKVSDAKECLMFGKTDNISFKSKNSLKNAKKLSFSEIQTNAILEMKMQRLIGLELNALQKELSLCIKKIEEYTCLLNSRIKMKNKIKKDLIEIKNRYALPRRTVLSNEKEVIVQKNTIKEENIHIFMDKFGYIKSLDESTIERNKDSVDTMFKHSFTMKNLDKLCIFTNTGKCHFVKGTDIPLCKFKDKGVMINNISNYTPSENIVYIIPFLQIKNKKLVFVNENGMVKIVSGEDFFANKKSIDATKKDSGELIYVNVIDNESDIVIKTKDNFFIRFKISEISEMKKTSIGVRGIKLKDDDKVVSANIGNTKSKIGELPFNTIKITKRDNFGTKKALT